MQRLRLGTLSDGKFAILINKFDGNNGRYVEKLFKRSYENEDGETVYTT